MGGSPVPARTMLSSYPGSPSLTLSGWSPCPPGHLAGPRTMSSSPPSDPDQTAKVVEEINTMFVEARDEIEYALEDSETVSEWDGAC